jgi:hypothetical protein
VAPDRPLVGDDDERCAGQVLLDGELGHPAST